MPILKTRPTNRRATSYPLLAANERQQAWAAVRGMWKDRKPSHISELNRARRAWDTRAMKLEHQARG